MTKNNPSDWKTVVKEEKKIKNQMKEWFKFNKCKSMIHIGFIKLIQISVKKLNQNWITKKGELKDIQNK